MVATDGKLFPYIITITVEVPLPEEAIRRARRRIQDAREERLRRQVGGGGEPGGRQDPSGS